MRSFTKWHLWRENTIPSILARNRHFVPLCPCFKPNPQSVGHICPQSSFYTSVRVLYPVRSPCFPLTVLRKGRKGQIERSISIGPVQPRKVAHLERCTGFFETFAVGPRRPIQTEISGNFGWMDRAQGLNHVILFRHVPACRFAVVLMRLQNKLNFPEVRKAKTHTSSTSRDFHVLFEFVFCAFAVGWSKSLFRAQLRHIANLDFKCFKVQFLDSSALLKRWNDVLVSATL